MQFGFKYFNLFFEENTAPYYFRIRLLHPPPTICEFQCEVQADYGVRNLQRIYSLCIFSEYVHPDIMKREIDPPMASGTCTPVVIK